MPNGNRITPEECAANPVKGDVWRKGNAERIVEGFTSTQCVRCVESRSCKHILYPWPTPKQFARWCRTATLVLRGDG